MHEILSLWISSDYADKYAGAFKILIVAYTLLSLCRSGHQTLIGLGKVKFTSLVYLFSSIFMLISLYFLSRFFGLIGAAIANLIMVILLVFNLYVYKTLSMQIRLRDVIEDLGWGIFLPLIVFFLSFFLPWITITGKIMITLLICAGFSIIMLRDKSLIKRLSTISHSLQNNSE